MLSGSSVQCLDIFMNDHHTFLSRPILKSPPYQYNELLWGDIEMSYAYSIVHFCSFDKILMAQREQQAAK